MFKKVSEDVLALLMKQQTQYNDLVLESIRDATKKSEKINEALEEIVKSSLHASVKLIELESRLKKLEKLLAIDQAEKAPMTEGYV